MFGEVLEGYDEVVDKIQNVAKARGDRPKEPVIIAESGELPLPGSEGSADKAADPVTGEPAEKVGSDGQVPLRAELWLAQLKVWWVRVFVKGLSTDRSRLIMLILYSLLLQGNGQLLRDNVEIIDEGGNGQWRELQHD